MFYALVVICASLTPVCDPEHAIFASQSPPEFSSDQYCQYGARVYLSDLSGLPEGVKYEFEITCERAVPWADA